MSALRTNLRGTPQERLTHLTMERHPNNQWSIILREGVLGPSLFEAYQLASLDECLKQLSDWRKGIIIV
jgi:hypothetical protein